MYYSQWDEEKYIKEFFEGYIGAFLDIGAYTGKKFSNTYRLVELGWSGVCVEPSPSVIPQLKILHENNNKINIIECAISDYSGKIKFYDSGGDAVSSCNEAHKIKWERGANSKFKEVVVDCLSVEDLFLEAGFSFDFINLDIEGDSVRIFSQLPFDKLSRLKLICVEYDDELNKAIEISIKNGFKEISREHGNLIIGRSF